MADLPGMRRRILVHPGDPGRRRHVTADGVEVLPVAAFVREVEEGTLFG